MVSLDINHPDSPAFAVIKRDLSRVTGANISLRLNKEFMTAVESDRDYILRYPCDKPVYESEEKLAVEYNKLYQVKDKCNRYVKRIKAKELWDTIIESAWQCAEPGIFHWNKLVDYDPSGAYVEFKPISTNPCGELGLSAYDSCRLIATNLYEAVDHPFTKNAQINLDNLYEIFYIAQILADVIVDLELEAVDRILEKINYAYMEEYKLW